MHSCLFNIFALFAKHNFPQHTFSNNILLAVNFDMDDYLDAMSCGPDSNYCTKMSKPHASDMVASADEDNKTRNTTQQLFREIGTIKTMLREEFDKLQHAIMMQDDAGRDAVSRPFRPNDAQKPAWGSTDVVPFSDDQDDCDGRRDEPSSKPAETHRVSAKEARQTEIVPGRKSVAASRSEIAQAFHPPFPWVNKWHRYPKLSTCNSNTVET